MSNEELTELLQRIRKGESSSQPIFDELRTLRAKLDIAVNALENAEEQFHLIWIKNEDFDTEETKNNIFTMAFNGRDDAKKALIQVGLPKAGGKK